MPFSPSSCIRTTPSRPRASIRHSSLRMYEPHSQFQSRANYCLQILGRVDITRTFDGPELNTEYLFGLFAQLALYPNSTTLLGVPVNYSIIHFTANQNIVSSSAIIYFDFTSLGLVLPVEIDGVNVYNAQGQLEEYDATFRWFQYLLDTLVATVTPELGFNSTTQTIEYFTQALAESICVTEVTYCNGTNQQYANYSACYEFLTTQVRFGQAYELGMNTLLCRMIHENMVPYRPSVHCPHIGPTGGGYCTDVSLLSTRNTTQVELRCAKESHKWNLLPEPFWTTANLPVIRLLRDTTDLYDFRI